MHVTQADARNVRDYIFTKTILLVKISSLENTSLVPRPLFSFVGDDGFFAVTNINEKKRSGNETTKIPPIRYTCKCY